MSFQEKLQVLRRERGLSQENLAEIIGISRQAIAKWECGRSYPDVNNLIKISNLFKVSIDKLVRDEEDGCFFINKEVQRKKTDGDIIEFLCRAKKIYLGRKRRRGFMGGWYTNLVNELHRKDSW